MDNKQKTPPHASSVDRRKLTPLRVSFTVCLIIVLFNVFSFAAIWTGGPPQTIKVIDSRGKEQTFERPARRIVCLIESALSGLYMLDAQQTVVGISANIYKPPVFPWYASMDDRIRRKQLPVPGNWDFVNIESVIALHPDVVIMWSKQTESIAALEDRGIKVFGVYLASKEDVYREISALGTLTGREKRARELVEYSRSELDRISWKAAMVPLSKRPSVYYMWAQGNLETSGKGSTVNDLITLAGARNVCGEIANEHLVVNMEQVIAWNPEVIVMWYNERKGPSDIINDPQWHSIRAVGSKRVYEMPEVFLCDLWTLKFPYAVKMLAKWCHPGVFSTLDLEQEKRGMLHKLYGSKLPGM